MRILSRNQFAMSNFNRESYGFNEIEEPFKVTIQKKQMVAKKLKLILNLLQLV